MWHADGWRVGYLRGNHMRGSGPSRDIAAAEWEGDFQLEVEAERSCAETVTVGVFAQTM